MEASQCSCTEKSGIDESTDTRCGERTHKKSCPDLEPLTSWFGNSVSAGHFWKERLEAHGGVVVLEAASLRGMASFYSQPHKSQHIGSPAHEEVDRSPEAPLFTTSARTEK